LALYTALQPVCKSSMLADDKLDTFVNPQYVYKKKHQNCIGDNIDWFDWHKF
jgi:hypothetical protein